VISKVTAGVTDKRGKRDRADNVLDAHGPRALVCVLAAIAIWVGFSVGFVRGLWNSGDKANMSKPVALDVRLVRLPPPEPPQAPRPPQSSQSAQQTRARAGETAARVTPAPTPPAVQTKPERATRHSVAPAPATPTQTRDVSRPAAAPVTAPPVVEGNERAPVTPPAAATAATTATPPAAASAATSSAHANAPQPNGPATPSPSANPANRATEGTSTSAGNGPAHAILQPLPSLPDDLREDAFQAVATARFSVHRDGSVDVELIKPTHNPRLNQLLLDALKKWRFFPAMKNGEAVESTQDIRVHFNVD
jgi:protein TonB